MKNRFISHTEHFRRNPPEKQQSRIWPWVESLVNVVAGMIFFTMCVFLGMCLYQYCRWHYWHNRPASVPRIDQPKMVQRSFA